MVFLFWNIDGNHLINDAKKAQKKEEVILSLLNKICIQKNVNVVFLSENKINNNSIISSLNKDRKTSFYSSVISPIPNKHISTFVSFNTDIITEVHSSSRFVVYKLSVPLNQDILLVALHLQSKGNSSEDTVRMTASKIRSTVKDLKEKHNIKRVLIVGDFNMNPFEKGMVAADSFHAMIDRNYVLKNGERIISEEKYELFYNPMWNFMGDNIHPMGTYYYSSSDAVTYFWHLFDQVIVNRDLLDIFDSKNIEILLTVDDKNLLNRNSIPDRNISDHLPLIFKLDIIGGF